MSDTPIPADLSIATVTTELDNGQTITMPLTGAWEAGESAPSIFAAIGAGNLLTNLCHQRSVAGGWWPLNPEDDHPLVVPTKIALIHSEVSEALEGHRKNKMDEHLPQHSSLAVELADAVIRICDLAGRLRIPLGTVIADKLTYNAMRADHKPEARAKADGKKF
jgi:NTP pyrophosphatase (non-canonical NTP hydrolase)